MGRVRTRVAEENTLKSELASSRLVTTMRMHGPIRWKIGDARIHVFVHQSFGCSRSIPPRYSVRVDTTFEGEQQYLAVTVDHSQDEWNDLRKHEGFVLLVALSDLP